MTNLNSSTPFYPKLIVFDLDGTLADTAPDIRLCLNNTMREYNLPEHDLKSVTGFIGNGTKKLIERAIPDSMNHKLDEIHTRFNHHYASETINETRLYDGALDVLRSKRAQFAILTNKPIVPTEIVLDHFGISEFFGSVMGGDNEFGRKPNPAALVEIMKQLNIEAKDVLMVGDGEPDVAVAQAAGVKVCALGSGFGDVEQLKAQKPNFFFNDFKAFSEAYLQGKLYV